MTPAPRDEGMKPCPFCKSAHVVVFNHSIIDDPDWFAQCQDCTTTGPRGATEEEACEKWNRRADSELLRSHDQLATEVLEQARLLGMSGSREAALVAERDRLLQERGEMVKALMEARRVIIVACGDKAPYVRIALEHIDAALSAAGEAKT